MQSRRASALACFLAGSAQPYLNPKPRGACSAARVPLQVAEDSQAAVDVLRKTVDKK